jgi:molybdopterin/thiamine biosynthesis adenylyltransferase
MRVNNNIELYISRNPDPTSVQLFSVERGTGKIFEFDLDESGIRFVEKMVVAPCGSVRFQAELSSDESSCLDFLIEQKIITNDSGPDSQHRFRSQLQWLSDAGTAPFEALNKLQKSSVGIIGAGATGGWIAEMLTRCGVGELRILDPDCVELSNLSRQPYNADDLHKKKVDALRERLLKINSELNIKTLAKMITAGEELFPFMEGVDLLMVAADHPSISAMGSIVSESCFSRNLNHIICGGYSGHSSALGVTVLPKKTACWHCYMRSTKQLTPPWMDPKHLIGMGPKNSAGFLPALMMGAATSATEAVRILVGLPPLLAESHTDFLHSSVGLVSRKFEKSIECKLCGPN